MALEDRDAAQLRRRLARVRADPRRAGRQAHAGARAARPRRPRPTGRRPRRANGSAKRTPPAKKPKSSNGTARLEAQIEAAEAALAAVEDELADPAAWASPTASARSTARHDEAKRVVAELYQRYEAVAG